MEVILVKVQSDEHKYDRFLLEKNKVIRYNCPSPVAPCDRSKIKRRRYKIYIDGLLAYYIMQEFCNSAKYCSHFVQKYREYFDTITFVMHMPQKQIIDYDWNNRMCHMVRERCELDHTLSWLSTLGGAFSALGDYAINYAEVAGKISFHQWSLALKMNDPNIIARCRLYFSLSLIQKGHYKLARDIIQQEYTNANNATIPDTRLLKMCQGIWSKLQYEHKLSVVNKKVKVVM